MLTLKSTAGQETVITVPPSTQTTEIRVMVAELRKNAVRLAWTARRDVVINRREIHEAIKREERAGK